MTKRIFAERSIYFGLFGLMIASIILMFMQDSWRGIWDIYSHVYFVLLLLYTWFIFILLFIGDRQKERIDAHQVSSDYYPTRQPKIAVLVPCFNEPAELLYKSLRSVILADGDKEILVIDDGSSDMRSKKLLMVFARKMGVKVHFFETNKGKRHAIHHAVTQMIGDVDLVVTIDSDTVLDKHAITELVKPFSDPRVGATSGDVQLLNEKKNLLTRMVGSYYWIGLHIYKKAQSTLGMVVCCSGCLSAYRADLLKYVIEDFVNQKFFGEQCTHSEDRHLTNLVLKNRYHVKFVPEAISYTETPSTIRGFLKQQQRWKRGYVRESIYTLTYAWKTRPLLFLEILLWELTIPYLSFGRKKTL